MITTILAAVLGWYLIIISLLVLFRLDHIKSLMADIMTQQALSFIVALITMIIGLVMVLSHNIWVIGWPVIVTLISWLVLISGLIRLFVPDLAIRSGKWFLYKPSRLQIAAGIFLIIGLYLVFNVYAPYYM